MNSNLGFIAGVLADHGAIASITIGVGWHPLVASAYPEIPLDPAIPGEEHLIHVHCESGVTHTATACAE